MATRSSARSHLLHPSSCHELLQNKLSVALFYFKLGLVHFFPSGFPVLPKSSDAEAAWARRPLSPPNPKSSNAEATWARQRSAPPEPNKPQVHFLAAGMPELPEGKFWRVVNKGLMASPTFPFHRVWIPQPTRLPGKHQTPWETAAARTRQTASCFPGRFPLPHRSLAWDI